MSVAGNSSVQRTLGILLAVAPEEGSFDYATGLASSAQEGDTQVYLYLLDDAVRAASLPEINQLIERGVKVSACAYAARKREIDLNDSVTFGGLGLLNDIITKTDRFVGFCH